MNFSNYKEFNYNDYSFEFNQINDWKQYLNENGFVVLKNIANEETCQKFKSDFWNVLNALSNADLNEGNNKRWAKNYPISLHGGMYTLGHTKPQWNIRYHCKHIFKELFGTDNLITSYDRFTYYTKYRRYKNLGISDWIHSDQSPLNKIESYQGMLCLSNNMEYKSGGFVCIPKTNLIHNQISEENGDGKNKKDWVKLTDDFKKKYVKNENILKVKNKIGDFVIWNSKTIHSGFAPINTDKENYDRIVSYVCMRPRKEATKLQLKRRLKAFKEKRCGSHNPVNFSLFNKNMERYSKLTYDEIMLRLKNKNLLEEDNDLSLV